MTRCGAGTTSIPIVEISRRAAGELAQARTWWLGHRENPPSAFDDDVDSLLAKLEVEPELVGKEQRGAKRRRILLRRIRYYVYFRIVDDGRRVEILAFWHASRGHGPRLR